MSTKNILGNLVVDESPGLLLSLIVTGVIGHVLQLRGLVIAVVIILIFILMFYRYTDYSVKSTSEYINNSGKILSPAEGKITNIWTHDGYTYVTIFLSVFDAHYQTVPINGIVLSHKYNRTGKFRFVIDANKSYENESATHHFMDINGNIIRMVQIAGKIPRRISYDNKLGIVQAGDYFGMIKLGSRVDIVYPNSYKTMVKSGQSVSHDTIIAIN